MVAFVYVRCNTCDWVSSHYHAGPSGRMMGVCTAGNDAEDEYDEHYKANHYNAAKRPLSGTKVTEENGGLRITW